MDENLQNLPPVEPAEPGTPGAKVQGITFAVMVAAGALLKGGVIGASVANPIAAVGAILSAFLPSLFRGKRPQARGLLGLATGDASGGLAAVAAGLGQLAAMLTAVLALLGDIPPGLVPLSWQPHLALIAAGLAAVLPGLSKLAEVFRRGS